MQKTMDIKDISSRICKLSSEITKAVINGHKAHDHDKFREHRRELVELRCQYFGKDSKLCKNERKNFR
jgi:hypothetical protein